MFWGWRRSDNRPAYATESKPKSKSKSTKSQMTNQDPSPDASASGNPTAVSRKALLARIEELEAERDRYRAEADATTGEQAAAAAHSERKYRTLVESIDEGFCVIQMLFADDGRPVDYLFLETNPAFVKQTGLADAVGRSARELLPGLEEHWFEIYGRVATTGESRRFIDQSEVMGRWFDVFAFLLEEPGSGKVALLFNDVTAQKLAEQERERLLREAEAAGAEAAAANRAKSEFLAAMSHELRTPLNAIGGYVELLDVGVHGPVTDDQRAALDRVAANQKHLLTLINDILSFARLEAGRIEITQRSLPVRDLLLSVESLVAPSAAAQGVTYVLEDCDPDLCALGDPERVRQILLNLVSNAIKFTAAGGAVTLSCDSDDDWVHLRVSDTGVGIAPDEQARIFDAFRQVERRLNQPREGVGLGLAISRDLAQAMGGEIGVESVPGQGSTFTLRLPRE
jgi:signal transduction histidine kinase